MLFNLAIYSIYLYVDLRLALFSSWLGELDRDLFSVDGRLSRRLFLRLTAGVLGGVGQGVCKGVWLTGVPGRGVVTL